MEAPRDPRHARPSADAVVLGIALSALDAAARPPLRGRGRRVARRDERGTARVPGLAHLVALRTGVTPDLSSSQARHRG